MNKNKYIVFVDESGDHNLTFHDPNYPIFCLAFCVFEINEYENTIIKMVEELKLKYFNDPMVILHEREIRKFISPFNFSKDIGNAFMEDLSSLIEKTPFTLIASVIRKADHKSQYYYAENPYSLSLGFCLERLHFFLRDKSVDSTNTDVILEARGKSEDVELELAFRKACDGQNYNGYKYNFNPLFKKKSENIIGLQIADLIARPIGRKILKPEQENKAYKIIESKFRKSSSGKIQGYGLKIFP